ncbi:MAG: hypothetical protein ABIF04_04165 [Chloroflexota bacterium]
MKIIDQTPFFQENGELSLMDRVKAIMQFGFGWFKEIEAQNSIIAVLDKKLDKNYTLLRNIVPPGLEARIPFILIGPTGVYVMYVTPLVGLFRAKGDQWGTIAGNAFKPERPNLLIRTERMARAVQVFLQRQGFTELSAVEAVLLCADPSCVVDSMRPIVRTVMRDALDYFSGSITQARTAFSPETVQDVVKHILNPLTAAVPPKNEETIAATVPATAQDEDPYVPAFALPNSEAAPASDEIPVPPSWFAQPATPPVNEPLPIANTRPRKKLTGKQWTFLISMFIIWCFIVIVIVFLVIKDLYL